MGALRGEAERDLGETGNGAVGAKRGGSEFADQMTNEPTSLAVEQGASSVGGAASVLHRDPASDRVLVDTTVAEDGSISISVFWFFLF